MVTNTLTRDHRVLCHVMSFFVYGQKGADFDVWACTLDASMQTSVLIYVLFSEKIKTNDLLVTVRSESWLCKKVSCSRFGDKSVFDCLLHKLDSIRYATNTEKVKQEVKRKTFHYRTIRRTAMRHQYIVNIPPHAQNFLWILEFILLPKINKLYIDTIILCKYRRRMEGVGRPARVRVSW